jgi:hypothetical protein
MDTLRCGFFAGQMPILLDGKPDVDITRNINYWVLWADATV